MEGERAYHLLPYNQAAHISAASLYSVLGGLVGPAAFQVLYTQTFAANGDSCVRLFRAFAAIAFLMAMATVLVSAVVLGMLLSLRVPYRGYQHESQAWVKRYKATWCVLYICLAVCMVCFVAMYFVGCWCFFDAGGAADSGAVPAATREASHEWVNTGFIDNNGGTVTLPKLRNSGIIYNSGNLSVADTLTAAAGTSPTPRSDTAAAVAVQIVLTIIGGIMVAIIALVVFVGCMTVKSRESSKGRYLLHVHIVAYELWHECTEATALRNVVVKTPDLLRKCQEAFQLHSDGPLPRAFVQLSYFEVFVNRYMKWSAACAVDTHAHTVTIEATKLDAFKQYALSCLSSGDWQP
jgi:hypothetical protein